MNTFRLGMAFLGFALALLSVALGDRRLAWAAIAALIVSLVIRLMLRKEAGRDSNPSE